MKKLFSILFGITLLACAVIAAYYAYFTYQKQQLLQKNQHTTVTREGVVTQIQELNRLETMAFHIDTVVKSEKKGNWYNLWQDQEKGLFVVKGQVVAGVDLSQLSAEDVTVSADGKKMVIDLPAAEIFSVALSDIQLYDYQKGWMNIEPLEGNVLQKVQSAARTQVKQSACEAQILQLANDNARKQMTHLFGLSKMDIVVQSAPALNC